MTGLGDRVHLARPEVGLSTHILDIVKVLEFEDLHEVVLVGHSYGGMVIAGVAERVPHRIAKLRLLRCHRSRERRIGGRALWRCHRCDGDAGW